MGRRTVTVYACSSTNLGYASATIYPTATGTYPAPSATGSPIVPYTGAAAANGVSAAAVLAAGALALVSISLTPLIT